MGNNMRLRILVTATCVFWLVVFIRSWYYFSFFYHADPGAAKFVATWYLSELGESAFFSFTSIALTLAVWRYRWKLGAVYLCILCLASFWLSYVHKSSIHFGPPFGDGSLMGAWRSWLVLHRPAIGWHMVKIMALAALAGSWYWAFFEIKKTQPQRPTVR